MGKAIAVASIVVLCSFTFVLLQLWSRKRTTLPPHGPAPILETRQNGDVVAVDIRLNVFERRLRAEEQRWVKLTADLKASQEEREALKDQVKKLQSELALLQKQVSARPPQPVEPPPDTPPPDTPTPAVPPVTPAPIPAPPP